MTPAFVYAPPIQPAFGAYLTQGLVGAGVIFNDEGGSPAVYPTRGRQDSSTDPYAWWRFTSYTQHQDVGGSTNPQQTGPPEIANAYCQVHCLSKVYETAWAVADAAIKLLQYSAPITGGPKVLGSWIVNAYDADAPEIGMFEAIVEVGMQLQLDLAG